MTMRPQIEEIEQDKRDQVLSPQRVRRFYLLLTPLLLGFVCLGIGGWFSADKGNLSRYAGLFYAIALVIFFGFFIFNSFFMGVYPARCYLRWLRENIDRRPDAIIDPDDPDAFFVQHIPRKNWQVTVGESAIDVGLLLIDYRKGIIKYEGDEERWIVPADSIVSFKLKSFMPSKGLEWLNQRTVVMLEIQLDDGEKVLTPLAAHPVHWRPWTSSASEAAAEVLRKAIGHLVDPKRCRRPKEEDLWPLIPPRG
jgi:hypothetical protein